MLTLTEPCHYPNQSAFLSTQVKYAIDASDPNRQAYAIKVLERKQIEKEGMQEQLRQEIAIMRLLSHSNIVKLLQVLFLLFFSPG